MKKSDRLRKDAEETMLKIRALTRHIRNVEDNCILLAEKLASLGETNLARNLVANGMVHDASKFFGIEWENLAYSMSSTAKEENAKLKMRMAVHHHTSTNRHHPEAWPQGIRGMPDVYLAEFCCDIKARSEEFGTDLRQWINESATKKWEFTSEDAVYQNIMKYVNLICPKPFEDLLK